MALHEQQITDIHYSLKREINELYWALALRGFATGLIGIFVPIYVYQFFNNALAPTLAFYLAQFVLHTLLVPWVSQLIKRVGVKKMMAIGNPFLALYIILLAMATQGDMTLIVLAVIAKVIYMSFFWPAFHIDFASFVRDKQRGRQIGTAQVVVAVAKVAAPFLAGLTIVYLGYAAVFIVGGLLVIISSVPLFFSDEVYEEFSLTWLASFKKLFDSKHRRVNLAFLFQGVERVSGLVLFPVFIFSVIGNAETIGWVTSLSLILALVVSYAVGWLSDKKDSGTVLNFSSVAHAFAWLINSFTSTVTQFLVFSSFFRMTEIASRLPFVTKFYEQAKAQGHNIDEYIVFHEITHNLGRIALLVLVLVGLSWGVQSWTVYFGITAVAAILFKLINNRNETLLSKFKRS